MALGGGEGGASGGRGGDGPGEGCGEGGGQGGDGGGVGGGGEKPRTGSGGRGGGGNGGGVGAAEGGGADGGGHDGGGGTGGGSEGGRFGGHDGGGEGGGGEGAASCTCNTTAGLTTVMDTPREAEVSTTKLGALTAVANAVELRPELGARETVVTPSAVVTCRICAAARPMMALISAVRIPASDVATSCRAVGEGRSEERPSLR